MSDSPFDPPKPKPPTAKETAGVVLGGIGLIAADLATGGLLSAIASIPSGAPDGPANIEAGLAAIADTAAPARDGDRAACTSCAAWVPYASMAINEHGYFCARCAASVTSG